MCPLADRVCTQAALLEEADDEDTDASDGDSALNLMNELLNADAPKKPKKPKKKPIALPSKKSVKKTSSKQAPKKLKKKPIALPSKKGKKNVHKSSVKVKPLPVVSPRTVAKAARLVRKLKVRRDGAGGCVRLWAHVVWLRRERSRRLSERLLGGRSDTCATSGSSKLRTRQLSSG